MVLRPNSHAWLLPVLARMAVRARGFTDVRLRTASARDPMDYGADYVTVIETPDGVRLLAEAHVCRGSRAMRD
jgi:hypothetical protein